MEKVRDALPAVSQELVFSFLSEHQTYLAMIQHRSFNLFLSRIQEYALLDSRDAAMNLFWESNLRDTRGWLTGETIERFWSGVPSQVLASLDRMRIAAIEFMKIRVQLISRIENGELQLFRLPKGKLSLLYPAIALLASRLALTVLTCDDIPLPDLRPIPHLRNLQQLRLAGTRISCVDDLSGLVNLQILTLGWNPIRDVSPLATLVNLRKLCLSETSVQDIRPLSSLVNLRSLSLAFSRVVDISPLSTLRRLEVLSLSHTQVRDLRPLSELAELWRLCLKGLVIDDITPLAGLHNLRFLGLVGCTIRNISSLSDLQIGSLDIF